MQTSFCGEVITSWKIFLKDLVECQFQMIKKGYFLKLWNQTQTMDIFLHFSGCRLKFSSSTVYRKRIFLENLAEASSSSVPSGLQQDQGESRRLPVDELAQKVCTKVH